MSVYEFVFLNLRLVLLFESEVGLVYVVVVVVVLIKLGKVIGVVLVVVDDESVEVTESLPDDE